MNQSLYSRSGVPLAEVLVAEPVQYVAAPSIESVDRSHWQPTNIRVTAAETEYRPVSMGSVQFSQKYNPRARGEYPSLQSALMLNWEPQRTGGDQWMEAAIEPWVQLGNFVLIPARALAGNRPTLVRFGPKLGYELTVRSTDEPSPIELR